MARKVFVPENIFRLVLSDVVLFLPFVCACVCVCVYMRQVLSKDHHTASAHSLRLCVCVCVCVCARARARACVPGHGNLAVGLTSRLKVEMKLISSQTKTPALEALRVGGRRDDERGRVVLTDVA